MPVPSSINDLSTNPASNSPDGTSEGPGTLDNYQRAHAAFIAQLRDRVQPLALGGTGATTAAGARTALGVAASGPATTSGLTLPTATIAGRTTAGTGAVEEISIGANLTLATGVLSAVDGVPPGAVTVFASNTAPSGWLKANGALVSRTTYAALFAAIGTTWGAGDGSTFGLPDLRGEFIRGWDDGRGVDSSRTFGSAQADAFQGHWHSLFGGRNDTGGSHNNGSSITHVGDSFTITMENSGSFVRQERTNGSDGTPRTGAETRPRNVALLACIKF